MSKSYPSNLTQDQWKLLEPLLPGAKRRGRPRKELLLILNVIFYILCEGCTWQGLLGDFPVGKQSTLSFATGVERGEAVARVHTVWVDGGYDGLPFSDYGSPFSRLIHHYFRFLKHPLRSRLKT
jgi:Putative transposase of IS4/5 family (DUF4096)